MQYSFTMKKEDILTIQNMFQAYITHRGLISRIKQSNQTTCINSNEQFIYFGKQKLEFSI